MDAAVPSAAAAAVASPPLRLHSLRTQRLNLPLREPLRMSFGEVREMQFLLLRLRDEDGVEGLGEAGVMGGPYWGDETIEGTHALLERYAAPRLAGAQVESLDGFSRLLRRSFRGHGSARAALEMAYLDLAGKKAGVNVKALLGGEKRDAIPVAWTLSSSDIELACEQADEALQTRGHRLFKLKVGIHDPSHEARFATALVQHLAGRAQLLVDANQGWDLPTAMRVLPWLREAGVSAIEQPIARFDLSGLARLQASSGLPVLLDETLVDPAIASLAIQHRAAAGFSLKPQRDGGFSATLQTAALAMNAGIECYGGTMLETSLGTAALLALYACVPTLAWGSELFGPLRLADDIVHQPLLPQDGVLQPTSGPGLGIALDEERISYLTKNASWH